jgi:NAD(P)-dependent dehydrogenase (short-subunit alcohol dehydrogenase family)
MACFGSDSDHLVGIGKATATAFALGGSCKIALLDISEANLENAKKEILSTLAEAKAPSIPIELVRCDVGDSESVANAYAKVVSTFGRVDYSIHSAGVFVPGGATTECSIEDFDLQNQIAYRGLWLCSREALKAMKQQKLDCEEYSDAAISEVRAQRGAIVNISSQLAKGWQENVPAYIAAKAAVVALTRCDALDYVGHRIRVNCVLPGIVETPMTTSNADMRAYMVAGPVTKTPMKRFGRPEEIADTCVFLAGNRSSFTTGAEFSIDGGYGAK